MINGKGSRKLHWVYFKITVTPKNTVYMESAISIIASSLALFVIHLSSKCLFVLCMFLIPLETMIRKIHKLIFTNMFSLKQRLYIIDYWFSTYFRILFLNLVLYFSKKVQNQKCCIHPETYQPIMICSWSVGANNRKKLKCSFPSSRFSQRG